jgi:hypothetical protein
MGFTSPHQVRGERGSWQTSQQGGATLHSCEEWALHTSTTHSLHLDDIFSEHNSQFLPQIFIPNLLAMSITLCSALSSSYLSLDGMLHPSLTVQCLKNQNPKDQEDQASHTHVDEILHCVVLGLWSWGLWTKCHRGQGKPHNPRIPMPISTLASSEWE